MLPAIAAVTSRIRLGSLVAPTSVHHPAVLANRAATIDHISNGRMVLGIGAGWQINEHRAYGIELEPPGPRVTRFEEAIQIMRALLSEVRTTFHGSVYSITDAPADPKPVQSPLPILVGTGSPRMLRATARWADEWNTWGDSKMAAERHARLVAACEQVDRDPATLWKSVNAMVDLGGTAVPPGRPELAGSAAEVVDQLGRYAEIGFDEFILPDWNLGDSHTARLDAINRFKAEVADQL
jgi:alkanesulfonate monooxygenase SsuD/methylene tetrahydromethanopterin reductase-like flavin-dependent oxidoreductase (luciferase family)